MHSIKNPNHCALTFLSTNYIVFMENNDKINRQKCQSRAIGKVNMNSRPNISQMEFRGFNWLLTINATTE